MEINNSWHLPSFIQLKIKYHLLQKPITLHCLLNMISFFVAAEVWPLSMDLSFVIIIFFSFYFYLLMKTSVHDPQSTQLVWLVNHRDTQSFVKSSLEKWGNCHCLQCALLKWIDSQWLEWSVIQCITWCLARWIVFLHFYIWVKFNWMSKNRTIIHVCYYMQPVV